MVRVLFLVMLACSFLAPQAAGAHEVYVLSHETIVRDVAGVSPNPFIAMREEMAQFLFWGVVGVFMVLAVFFMSVFRKFERLMMPLLVRLKLYAPLVARLTLGVCLIACALFDGLFGPELPLTDFAGAWAPLLQLTLGLIGVLIGAGLFTRPAALVALAIFIYAAVQDGVYLLTYTNYLGEILLTLILGSGAYSVEKLLSGSVRKSKLVRRLEPYAFVVARVCFGFSVLFAAFYAKFLHSQLALDTVIQYRLTDYFHFSPLFVVLGALIVETLIGLFFILGIEVRFTALFFLFWLTLSLLYFGEAVWPHLILIGLNLALICHGYDRFGLEGRLFKRGRMEPVL